MQICTFIGHSSCDMEIKKTLYNTISELISAKGITTFYVGTHGDFDRYVYNTLCELKEIYNIEIYVILSYINKIPQYCKNAKTIFPNILEKTPLRFAITKRNLYMIGKSQYMICYLENTFTNTYKFVKIAYNRKLNIINLGAINLNDIFKNQ